MTGPEEAALDPDPAARAFARRTTWGGVALFWLVLGLFAVPLRMPLLDALLLSVLLAVVPAFSLAQVPLVRGVRIERMPAYWGSIVSLWLLGTGCWLVGTRAGGPAAVGLVAIPVLPLLGWSLGLTGAALAVILVFRPVVARLGGGDDALLRQLLPQGPRERRVFALLSVAAGFGEEMAYRGYAIPALAALTGTSGAAVITTVVFGILHAYQGRAGILRTGVMGGILAWGFLASGSLWPPIIAHTLVDLLAGIVLGERLLAEGRS